MKLFDSADIRNVALVGHGHSGKTSLCSALLFTAGATDRQLSVTEGNTITDFDEEEVSRQLSITSAVASFPWEKTKFNLLDTPGFSLFLHDTRSVMTAADAVVLVVDGVAGFEASAEKVFEYAEQLKLPCAFVINKLDRERASFEQAMESLTKACGRAVIPIHQPVQNGKALSGIIDLISMRCFSYEGVKNGRGTEGDIPSALSEAASTGHEALVEMIAEGEDALMDEFFATGTLPVEHIVSGLQEEIRDRRVFPVLCAAALQNVGSDLLLRFIADILPSPLDAPPRRVMQNNQEAMKGIEPSSPPSIFVFKTAADPFAGRVSYFKVMAGAVKDDSRLTNMRTNAAERLAHIAAPFGKGMNPVPEMRAGDIGVVAKLKDTLTGDTLCEKTNCVVFQPVEPPEPAIAYAITAKTRSDEDRLSAALAKILEEDQCLRFYRDPQTKEFLLAGNGQQHLEVVVRHLQRRYGVDVELKAPKIPYRETVRAVASAQGRHKKQTGGHGQFGDCWIKIEPLPRGEKFQFANEVFGGAIPKQYIPAVEKGIVEAAQQGFLAGYPVTDFKVTLYDGSYHDVDSSEMAFKLAGRKAFRAAMQQCRPAILEPIMKVEVETPAEFAGDLMSDFNGRRGRISGMDLKNNHQSIRAQVPMSEMLSYQDDLISKTQGRASFHMEFDHYDYVPAPQAEKIISAAKAHMHAEDEE
ncbi:MAG: elongation factor G [Bryobacteraceae bacterium]